MPKYFYEGPVMCFDVVVDRRWKGETVAISEKKARSNMTYSYKKDHGYSPYAAIRLPNKIQIEGKENYHG